MENKLLKEFIFNTFEPETIMQADNISDYESDINLFQALTESADKENSEKNSETK